MSGFPLVVVGFALIGGPVALIRGAIASIRQVVALIRDVVALVGGPVAFVSGPVPRVAICVAHPTVPPSAHSPRCLAVGVQCRAPWASRHPFGLLHSCWNGDGADVVCESVLGDRSLVAGDRLFNVHFELPATLQAPSRARQLVAETLDGSDALAGDAEGSYTAQLLVTELVTNAVMHARTELHLGISGDAETLLFTIADGHPDLPPEAGTAAAEVDAAEVSYEESGRGMAIIVGLATDFGWRRRDDGAGKVMWFTLALSAAGD